MDDFKIIKPKYSKSDLAKFTSNDSFMDASVELLKQTIDLLYRIVSFRYFDIVGNPKILKKDEAVLGGNLVRLIKLNISFLQNVCANKLEICYIINRCIAETYVNIKYILIEGEERVNRNYIKYSLITEKELWETISSNIKDREDKMLPIEKRMQKSIQRSFDDSDFDIEEVKRSSKWKSVKSRADIVAGEMFYSVYYGIASHAVHGNWQDILSNNLKKKGDGFELNLNWQKPKPQIIDGPIVLNLDIINLFNDKELEDHNHFKSLKEILKTLFIYDSDLKESHEKWLNQ